MELFLSCKGIVVNKYTNQYKGYCRRGRKKFFNNFNIGLLFIQFLCIIITNGFGGFVKRAPNNRVGLDAAPKV